MRLRGRRDNVTRRVTLLEMLAQEGSDEVLLTAIARAVGGQAAGELRVRFANGNELVWRFRELGKDEHGKSTGD